jgi:hypothetical protein
MKQLIFIFAILLGFTSCKKEVVEPTPTPPSTQNTSYDKFVITHQTGLVTDSIVFENSTAGTAETIPANISSINCGTDKVLAEFPLSSSPSSGDEITVTIYHNSYTWGSVAISDFLANSTTVLCDEIGGNSGNQLSSGSTTILDFSVD